MIPDHTNFFRAAYAIALGVYALYAITLMRRRARVRAELERLGAAEGGRRDGAAAPL